MGQLDLFVKLEAEERKKEQEQLIGKLKADVLASLKGQARGGSTTARHSCFGRRLPS